MSHHYSGTSLNIAGEPVLHIAGRDHFVSASWPIMMHSALRCEDSSLHDHDFLEIAVIVGGEGIHASQSGEVEVSAGDVFVVRPGSWHVYRDCHRLRIQNCCFSLDLLAHDLAFAAHMVPVNYALYAGPLAHDRGGVLHLKLPGDALRSSRRHLDALFEAGKNDGPRTRLVWTGHLLLFLEQLVANLGDTNMEEAARVRRIHPAVREGTRLLNDDLAYAWTLHDLSTRLHLNSSYLVRLFKAGTGLAPLAYLARRRAEAAATLLVRTELTVAEIGARVGWRDPSYFSQRFKAHYGLSAGAYRARFGQLSQELDS